MWVWWRKKADYVIGVSTVIIMFKLELEHGNALNRLPWSDPLERKWKEGKKVNPKKEHGRNHVEQGIREDNAAPKSQQWAACFPTYQGLVNPAGGLFLHLS